MNLGGEFTIDTKHREMISVRIPKEMNRALTDYLKTIGLTKNAFILSLIKKELQQEALKRFTGIVATTTEEEFAERYLDEKHRQEGSGR